MKGANHKHHKKRLFGAGMTENIRQDLWTRSGTEESKGKKKIEGSVGGRDDSKKAL